MKRTSLSLSLAAAGLTLGLAGLPAHAQDAAAAQATTPVSDADKAYQIIEDLNKERPPKDLPQEEFGTWFEIHMVKLSDNSERFMSKYPDDPRYWKVANTFTNAASQLAGMNAQRAGTIKETVSKALASATIAPDDWAMFKGSQINEMMGAYRGSSDKAKDLAAIRGEIDALAQRAPKFRGLGQFEMQYVGMLNATDPAAATEQLKKLAASDNEAVAKQAAGKLKVAEARQKPVELKFTSLDGKKVDLKKMRGKVVLVDFWATWCGPCKAELPNLKAVYEKYHKQGFEVVGVSLDSKGDRKKLEDFVKSQKLAWPQYLDETNERNRIAEEYGINAIPAPLLFNKKGLLVEENARGEKLDEMVKGLLEG